MKANNSAGRSTPAAKVIAAIILGVGGMAALPTQAGISLDIDIAPPEPRVETVPPPRAGYVWAPGYYDWNGRQHVWVGGRWVHERRGQRWVADRWDQRDGHYHHERGHWERS